MATSKNIEIKPANTALLILVLVWLPLSLLSFYHLSILLSDVLILEQKITADLGSTNKHHTLSKKNEAPPLIRKIRRAVFQQHSSVELIADIRDLVLYGVLLWISVLVANVFLIWLVMRKSQEPLVETATIISQLSEGDLNTPIRTVGSSPISRVVNQLEKLRQQLAYADKSQSEFLREVSHQIKTPLTSIKEGSKLLDEGVLGELSTEQREVAEIIVKSATELQQSVEDLLSYNQAISAKRHQLRTNTNLQKLVLGCLNKMQLQLRNKKIEVIDRTEPIEALVDKDQFATIFDNLLSNAIKYSPQKGKILLELRSEPQAVIFTIEDEGPGIPNHQRLSIFNAFFVGNKPPSEELEGTGLGLSIARQYVEQHQGTIEVVNSTTARLAGACFRVRVNI